MCTIMLHISALVAHFRVIQTKVGYPLDDNNSYTDITICIFKIRRKYGS